MIYEFLNDLNDLVSRKLVSKRKHPDHDLYIYNYTSSAMNISPDKWTDAMIDARGLILDGDGEVIARGMRKFWNLNLEDKTLWKSPFTVYEKMDGSLILLVKYKDDLIFASRGSFTSDQAIMAKEIWNEKYSYLSHLVGWRITCLFELIHPNNQIVVNYGNKKDLVFLCAINNDTGSTVKFPMIYDFPTPKTYGFNSIQELVESKQDDNKEGYVIHFHFYDIRYKFKFEHYKALHRARFMTSNRTIWECLYNRVDPLLAIPEEDTDLRNWVTWQVDKYKEQMNNLMSFYSKSFYEIRRQLKEKNPNHTRKDFALEANKYTHPVLLYLLLDERVAEFENAVLKVCYPSEVIFYKREVKE